MSKVAWGPVSAIGYVTPKDRLEGRQGEIFAAHKRKQGVRTKIAKISKVGRHSLDRDPDEFSEKPGVF